MLRTVQGVEWPEPPGALCSLTRDEAMALEYFDLWEHWYEVLEDHGRAVAERFADEASLRLHIYNPPLGDLSDGHRYRGEHTEGCRALVQDILRTIAAWPEYERRLRPMQPTIQVVRTDMGVVAAYPNLGPGAWTATDRPAAIQLSPLTWKLCQDEPQLEEEIFARVEMDGPQPVAELVESYIRRWYAEERVPQPLGARVYTGENEDGQLVCIVCGEDDPVPRAWQEERQRHAERLAALETWARQEREFWWDERHDGSDDGERPEAMYRGNRYQLTDDVAQRVRDDIHAAQRQSTAHASSASRPR